MLAGRSQRPAWRRGDPFFFERRDGILVHERFLTQPDSMHIDVLTFVPRFSDAYLLSRSFIWCIAEPHVFIKCHQDQSQGLGKTGTRKKTSPCRRPPGRAQSSQRPYSARGSVIFPPPWQRLSADLVSVLDYQKSRVARTGLRQIPGRPLLLQFSFQMLVHRAKAGHILHVTVILFSTITTRHDHVGFRTIYFGH